MKLERVTESRTPPRRWYDDACGTAFGMELLGERWSLLIVRELMLGPRRFGELRAGLPGISANVLTQRLEGLEADGILGRHRLPPPANAQVYELSAWGYETEPIIQALGRWAARSPDHDPTLPLSPVSMMLSLRTMLDRDAAAGMSLTVGFRFGREAFTARVVDGAMPVTRGEAPADLRFVTDPGTMAAIVYDKRPIAEAEADGSLAFEGDRVAAGRFLALFALPPKAG